MKPHSLKVTTACLVLLAPAFTPRVSAQDLPYSSGSTGVDGALAIPGTFFARYDHAMVYDGARQRTVLFGGYSSAKSSATWEYNGTTWTAAAPVTIPSARTEHALAYDPARQRVIMFGGSDVANAKLDDLWEYNGTAWTQAAPPTKPAARDGHAMTFDTTRNVVVLFGGATAAASGNNDTWEYNGTTWSQISPATKPPARYDHSLVYDSVRQRVVLFGGYDISIGPVDDTWEYNGTNWSKILPATKPPARQNHSMAYDSARQRVVLFGGQQVPSDDTWEYNGATSAWTLISPATKPSGRYDYALAYDTTRQRVVLSGGYTSAGANGETWEYNGTTWTFKTGPRYEIDMSAKANGVWNFTTIDIPGGVTVFFKKNPANSPVQWLASGAVTINGGIDLSGSNGRAYTNVEPGNEAPGGPGGFDGGLGGRLFPVSGSYIGTAGAGPGGGKPGAQTQSGEAGKFNGTYGNSFLQPLIGGSGGGGGASTVSYNGGNGGGGGGVMLIASSLDIVLNGTIDATGGGSGSAAQYSGGGGSGGGVRLVADRISGGGTVNVGSGTSAGRIRMDAYYRPLAANGNSTPPSTGPPTENFVQLNNTALTVATVDGVAVRVPAGGSTANPDVIFNKSGSTTITVTGNNIPNGTPVKLRITGGTGLLELPATGAPAVLMNNNSATFTATVPAGVGTVQAFATIPLAPVVP